MNTTLHIAAFFDEPEFIQNLVEQLACRHYDLGYGKEKMPTGWKALETSSTETYAGGTVALDYTGPDENETGKEEHINMPFITSFLFTCIKGEKESYRLSWSSSLS
jgi:hypothetical protein